MTAGLNKMDKIAIELSHLQNDLDALLGHELWNGRRISIVGVYSDGLNIEKGNCETLLASVRELAKKVDALRDILGNITPEVDGDRIESLSTLTTTIESCGEKHSELAKRVDLYVGDVNITNSLISVFKDLNSIETALAEFLDVLEKGGRIPRNQFYELESLFAKIRAYENNLSCLAQEQPEAVSPDNQEVIQRYFEPKIRAVNEMLERVNSFRQPICNREVYDLERFLDFRVPIVASEMEIADTRGVVERTIRGLPIDLRNKLFGKIYELLPPNEGEERGYGWGEQNLMRDLVVTRRALVVAANEQEEEAGVDLDEDTKAQFREAIALLCQLIDNQEGVALLKSLHQTLSDKIELLPDGLKVLLRAEMQSIEESLADNVCDNPSQELIKYQEITLAALGKILASHKEFVPVLSDIFEPNPLQSLLDLDFSEKEGYLEYIRDLHKQILEKRRIEKQMADMRFCIINEMESWFKDGRMKLCSAGVGFEDEIPMITEEEIVESRSVIKEQLQKVPDDVMKELYLQLGDICEEYYLHLRSEEWKENYLIDNLSSAKEALQKARRKLFGYSLGTDPELVALDRMLEECAGKELIYRARTQLKSFLDQVLPMLPAEFEPRLYYYIYEVSREKERKTEGLDFGKENVATDPQITVDAWRRAAREWSDRKFDEILKPSRDFDFVSPTPSEEGGAPDEVGRESPLAAEAKDPLAHLSESQRSVYLAVIRLGTSLQSLEEMDGGYTEAKKAQARDALNEAILSMEKSGEDVTEIIGGLYGTIFVYSNDAYKGKIYEEGKSPEKCNPDFNWGQNHAADDFGLLISSVENMLHSLALDYGVDLPKSE